MAVQMDRRTWFQMPDAVNTTPTQQLYGTLQQAADHFNAQLFSGALNPCLITVQRERGSCMGFFSANRWAAPDGTTVHELAVNPAFFAKVTLLEVLQTLAHEMTHQWQHEHGQPSRSGYHNSEWADKMEAIGLMPSSTGRPGGKRTGQRMADYPIAGGPFEQACVDLVGEGFALPFIDRWTTQREPRAEESETANESVAESAEAPVAPNREELQTLTIPLASAIPNLVQSAEGLATAKNKQKVVYSCPSCETRVWGKPALKLICGECGASYTDDSDKSPPGTTPHP